jgi:hypothetical protein
MSNELTVFEKDLAEMDDRELRAALQVGGLEKIDPGRHMPTLPRLVLAQKKVGENVNPGEWYISGREDELGSHEVAHVIPLAFLGDGQVKWPETFSTENMPMCASDDGINPRPSTQQRPLSNPQPGPCATCPDGPNSWGPNNEPPRCASLLKFLVAVQFTTDEAEDPTVCLTSFQRTGMNAGRRLVELITSRYGVRQVIGFSSRFKEGDKGSWYEPVVARLKVVPIKNQRGEGTNPMVKLIAGLKADNEGRIERGELIAAADVRDEGDVIDGEVVNETPAPPEEEMGDPIPF